MKNTLLLIFLLAMHAMLQAKEIVYVSPQGNDLASGSKSEPFHSLNKAIEGRLNNAATDTLVICMAPGDYYLNRPFTIDRPSSRPIVIQSATTEKARLIGGVEIKGWQQCGDKLYRAYIPEVSRFGFSFEQFYVNGQRATLARTPNADWNYVKGSKEQSFVKGTRFAAYATQQIQLDPADLHSLQKVSAEDVSSIKIRFYHKWDNTQKRIEYLNVDSGYVYIKGKGMHPWNPIANGSRYILYNYKEALDVPGEWYLDKREGYIYYMPREQEKMDAAVCFAPALHQLVAFKGEPDRAVKNIHFRHISFQYTSYTTPANGDEPIQAAAPTEAALMFDYTENVSFTDCDLQHTGGYGIWFRQECHNNRVERCYMADLGAGGIKIGEPYYRQNGRAVTGHNVICNNIITHAGSELPCGVGVAMFHTSDNQVVHNEISDLRYSGISIGWVWGYNQSPDIWTSSIDEKGVMDFLQTKLVSPAVRNVVEYNHIHHIGWGELSDMGAVYTLGESAGTRISNNVIHDVLSYDYGGWGLYTDEGSTGVEMTNNLVYRCKSGGFHQHYGKENKIENNIFAFGHYYQAQYTRVEPHLSFSFKHNIIVQDKGETLAGVWERGNIEMDYNLYWHYSSAPAFGSYSPKEWFKRKEPHSIVANPLFKDAKADNYEFASLQAVRKIKFKPFDHSKAGVYGSAEWMEKARLSAETLKAFEEAAITRLKK